MLYNDFMWNNFIQFQMFAGNLWTDPQYEKLVLSFEISQYQLRRGEAQEERRISNLTKLFQSYNILYCVKL